MTEIQSQFSPVSIVDSGSIKKHKDARKHIENPETQQSERMYHELMEQSKDADWLLGDDGKYRFKAILEFIPEEKAGFSIVKEIFQLFIDRPIKGITYENWKYGARKNKYGVLVNTIKFDLVWEK